MDIGQPKKSVRDQIIDVLDHDIQSYMARDKPAWEQNWQHSPAMTSIMECGALQVARGYEAFRDNIFQAMDIGGPPSSPEVDRDNINIQVRGDIAWAVFDQLVTHSDDPVAPSSFSHNVRIFERHEDRWRIAFHGVWDHPTRDSAAPTLEVDRAAKVIWMNDAARSALPGFPGLSVSHGTLRAARPAWDKKLRAILERADGLRNYAAMRQQASAPGRPLRIPVLLGEGEDGSVLLAHVQVANGRIYVCFGDTSALKDQIAMAGLIFGLSDAQMSLARLIADGADLAVAAEEMGVSLNTARTHLRRMFDKTEVRSQLDLLRLFLSLG